MIDTNRIRQIGFNCKFCKKEFNHGVEFGAFIKFVEEIDVSVFEERPGRIDNWLRDVVCPVCGCCSGLEILDKPISL